MTNSNVMKKLMMATAGAALIGLGAIDKAEASAFNGTSLKNPPSIGLTSPSLELPEDALEDVLDVPQSLGLKSPSVALPEDAPAIQEVLTTNIEIGGPWYQFGFDEVGKEAIGCTFVNCTPSSAGNSVFASSPPWEFEVGAAGASLKVTDAFLLGDQFKIFNFDTLLGITSTPSQGGSCGDNPDICFANPGVSKGTFNLVSGQYSLRIVPTVSPFGSGSAFFRVDQVDEVKEVSEPMSVLGLLVFGALAAAKSKQRQQQSLR